MILGCPRCGGETKFVGSDVVEVRDLHGTDANLSKLRKLLRG